MKSSQRVDELWQRYAMLAFLALSVAPPAAAQTDPAAGAPAAGIIGLVDGEVSIIGGDGVERAAQTDEVLRPGDTVRTGVGELQATMEDGGYLAVRPSTEIRIETYRSEGETDDEESYTLLTGAVRLVTGFIARINPQAHRVSTPVATIGIRGTDYEVIYIPPGVTVADETPGTHARVYRGLAILSTATGILSVPPGRAGFVDARSRTRPRLHPGIPGFIKRRAGRHDAAIEQHGRRIREHIEQKLRARGKLKRDETVEDYVSRKRAARSERREDRGRHDLRQEHPRGRPDAGNSAGNTNRNAKRDRGR